VADPARSRCRRYGRSLAVGLFIACWQALTQSFQEQTLNVLCLRSLRGRYSLSSSARAWIAPASSIHSRGNYSDRDPDGLAHILLESQACSDRAAGSYGTILCPSRNHSATFEIGRVPRSFLVDWSGWHFHATCFSFLAVVPFLRRSRGSRRPSEDRHRRPHSVIVPSIPLLEGRNAGPGRKVAIRSAWLHRLLVKEALIGFVPWVLSRRWCIEAIPDAGPHCGYPAGIGDWPNCSPHSGSCR
jgi:hypothetical protein